MHNVRSDFDASVMGAAALNEIGAADRRLIFDDGPTCHRYNQT